MHRRTLLVSAVALTDVGRFGNAKADTPGVTATEIKIGNTFPYSGPASSFGVAGRALAAYFRRLNERGGVAGRRINFISLDDGYLPPKTVEQTRRLVEQEGVAFMVGQFGTAPNIAVHKYLNLKKVPQLFIVSGLDIWANYAAFPWTIGLAPSSRNEAQVYAKYILANKPDAKIGILFQNDDLGKEYVIGVKDVLGDRYADRLVKEVSFEITDPTIDSQAVTLQSSGANVLVTAAIPKFAAQTIRKIYDLGWKPLHCLSQPGISVASTIIPAGPERAIGLITAGCWKDNTDPTWKDDADMQEWRAFMANYVPDVDTNDRNLLITYAIGQTTEQMLRQCGDDFSRDNIMRQATDLHHVHCASLLPGITVNTSPTNYHPIRQRQFSRWTGRNFELFGELIEASSS